ncbi:Cold shock-like protein [subsurface metagenome]
MKGRIEKIMTGRGFGFIELDEGKDIFFHCSDVEGDFKVLEEGDLVSFEITEGRDGKDKAINVKKIEE